MDVEKVQDDLRVNLESAQTETFEFDLSIHEDVVLGEPRRSAGPPR